MGDKPSLTRRQAIEQVLAQLDGPIEVNELCRRALDIWPSSAKDPLTSMRNYVRQDEIGKSLIFVKDKIVLPIRIAMKGVRFRIPLSRREAKRGLLIVDPAFDYFLRREIEPESVQLVDARGQPLPTRLTTIKQQIDGPFRKHTMEYAAFDLEKWFREQGVRRKDYILVTVAIPTAYSRLSNPRGYPGSHWLQVISHDPRMRTDGRAINYADSRAPLEQILHRDKPVPQAAFSPEQGRQIYRFKAALENQPGLWRVVEIQGKQTLADLDRILRDAFQHSSSDHMGGFWKRVRRGKSKRFRKIKVGTLNPFGGGTGADVAIAGLKLEPGQELEYVYDFGDWIEHRMTLEAIGKAEKEAAYPRIIDQNKPRYRNCESCRAQGTKTRATWICVTCSNRQQRELLLCQDCLNKEHEDHYVEEILY